MNTSRHPVALVTGGSRGIGAAAALALAKRGYAVAITYRNKVARANDVAGEIARQGVRSLSIQCDITLQEDRVRLFEAFTTWSDRLDVLVLNASGGLERDMLTTDPEYPMRINHDAQVSLVEAAQPLMPAGSSIIFVTSHWAHLHGQIVEIPVYGPVAASKHAGEQALRARQDELASRGIRLIVVTGDLVEGTITPKLMDRAMPGLVAYRRNMVGQLPTAADMGEAIAAAAADNTQASGSTVVVGGALESLPRPE